MENNVVCIILIIGRLRGMLGLETLLGSDNQGYGKSPGE